MSCIWGGDLDYENMDDIFYQRNHNQYASK